MGSKGVCVQLASAMQSIWCDPSCRIRHGSRCAGAVTFRVDFLSYTLASRQLSGPTGREEGTPMRVAVVDSDLPFPPTSGKRLRSLHLLLPLAKRHRITYVCPAPRDTPEAKTATDLLRDHGVEPVLYDDVPPRKSGPDLYARLAVNLLSSRPYSVSSMLGPALRAAVAALAVPGRADLV